MVSAASATPSGWAVCRSPMARPRSFSGNQPSTTRPLAAFTDAPAAPAAPHSSVMTIMAEPPEGRASATATISRPDRPSPATIVSRSPCRSTTAPHSTSVNSRPVLGAATMTPAWASDTPVSPRNTGSRYGRPNWNMHAAV